MFHLLCESRGIKKNVKFSLFAGLICLIVSISLFGRAHHPRVSLTNILSNQERIVVSIRDGLRNHASGITITFSCGNVDLEELEKLTVSWIEQALAETDCPEEGDYIRYQYGGCRILCRRVERDHEQTVGQYIYQSEIIPEYYTYLVQEEAVSEKITDLLDGFAFTDETTDYEKIRVIYDYICGHVRYDRVHQKNPYYHIKSTAYAALIRENAACQGYCAALYRMLRQAGQRCRIVTGMAQNGEDETRQEFHAWNLVELDGLWYYLDATWDADCSGAREYTCFLKGQSNFKNHTLGAEFTDGPISETDWPADRAF